MGVSWSANVKGDLGSACKSRTCWNRVVVASVDVKVVFRELLSVLWYVVMLDKRASKCVQLSMGNGTTFIRKY
jgi:hypothetical protein